MERKGKKKTVEEKLLWRFFFEKLLQEVDLPILISDTRARCVFSNGKFLSFFRISKEDITGKSWIDSIIPEDGRRPVRAVFSDIKRNRTVCWFDTPVLAKDDGRENYLCWISIPLLGRKNVFFMFIGQEKNHYGRRDIVVHPATRARALSTYRALADMLFKASRACDPETAKHSHKVMFFAGALGKKLGLSKEQMEKLRIAALLHDLGKLAVDQKVLFKKGKLNEEEFEEVKTHLQWGYDILQLFYFMKDVVFIMDKHHENHDGKGYPMGISGKKIPIEAKILTVADIYEALTSDRPYRKAFSVKDAVAIMEYEKGHKLDPHITDTFLDMVREGGFEGEVF